MESRESRIKRIRRCSAAFSRMKGYNHQKASVNDYSTLWICLISVFTDLEDLEECGPSPGYDRYTNQPDTNDTACATDQPTTTSTATLAAATLQPPAATPEKLQARFLRTTTIGEDYAPCRAQIAADSEVERYYTWNETITAQCYDTL